MSPVLLVLVIMVAATAISIVMTRSDREDPNEERAWDRALKDNDSLIGGGMLKMARPLSRSSYVQNQAKHPAWRALNEKVIASGLYGGSMEVFLSYQAMSMLVGITLLLCALLADGSALLRMGMAAMGFAVSILPYNRIQTTLKNRTEEVGALLPEFAELLQMPMSSGLSVVQALRFTASHSEGVVANEVRWLLDSMAQPTKPEEEYFRDAGRRLGTPEASAFFNALGQAHVEGVKVVQSLQRQAEALRTLSYQQRRAKMRQLPVKLILTFAMHFLPLIFALTFLPLMYSMSTI